MWIPSKRWLTSSQKCLTFSPCKKTPDASHIASIFLREIVRLLDIPKTINSNRDVKFMRHFWSDLWKRLSTTLNLSSAYHLQIDVQIEVINKSVGNMLRCLVKEQLKQWEILLPHMQFSLNSIPNRTTRKSYFSIVYTKVPNFTLDLSLFPNLKSQLATTWP